MPTSLARFQIRQRFEIAAISKHCDFSCDSYTHSQQVWRRHWLRFRWRSAISNLIDLLMGLFREAVFHHGGGPENCSSAFMGRFPSSMGRFPSLMGRFLECLNGPFSLLKIPWETAHEEKGIKRFLISTRNFAAISRRCDCGFAIWASKVWMSSSVVGVFHLKGWGVKKFGLSRENPGNQSFWQDVPRKLPGISWRCPKSLVVFNSWPLD